MCVHKLEGLLSDYYAVKRDLKLRGRDYKEHLNYCEVKLTIIDKSIIEIVELLQSKDLREVSDYEWMQSVEKGD